ncbi:hypothetical protein EVAR_102758_1 [Eumeta japonica]|uniref:Uncharacterized protein n=1 Tax=Eumeta variegata TaxID=151549 RepID=A0A4C1THS4_EUMVA|nr:hypothetical protein EVAR_102758_1 [Eumeta japonica]
MKELILHPRGQSRWKKLVLNKEIVSRSAERAVSTTPRAARQLRLRAGVTIETAHGRRTAVRRAANGGAACHSTARPLGGDPKPDLSKVSLAIRSRRGPASGALRVSFKIKSAKGSHNPTLVPRPSAAAPHGRPRAASFVTAPEATPVFAHRKSSLINRRLTSRDKRRYKVSDVPRRREIPRKNHPGTCQRHRVFPPGTLCCLLIYFFKA